MALAHFQRVAPDVRLGDEARFFLALCFYRKGLLDLAQNSFQTCMPESGPVDGRTCEILYHLGLIAEQQGDAAQAKSHFSRIYAVDIGFRGTSPRKWNNCSPRPMPNTKQSTKRMETDERRRAANKIMSSIMRSQRKEGAAGRKL